MVTTFTSCLLLQRVQTPQPSTVCYLTDVVVGCEGCCCVLLAHWGNSGTTPPFAIDIAHSNFPPGQNRLKAQFQQEERHVLQRNTCTKGGVMASLEMTKDKHRPAHLHWILLQLSKNVTCIIALATPAARHKQQQIPPHYITHTCHPHNMSNTL